MLKLPTNNQCVWLEEPDVKGSVSPQCDQVMEFSWSALWNITDETPDNCQMFLNCRGMSLFLDCLQVSHVRQEYTFFMCLFHTCDIEWLDKGLSHHRSIFVQEFPDKQELHRNMLGLLGNVAEVKALRPQLLTPQFITVFRYEDFWSHFFQWFWSKLLQMISFFVVNHWNISDWNPAERIQISIYHRDVCHVPFSMQLIYDPVEVPSKLKMTRSGAKYAAI